MPARPATRPPLPPQRSVPAKTACEFGWSALAPIARQLVPVLKAHRDELRIEGPFDPDWDRLFQLDAAKVLRIWTARDGEALIGYIAWIVAPSLMSREFLWAHAEMFWLNPAWRGGWTGYQFLKTSIFSLETSGIHGIDIHTNVNLPRVGIVLKRLGFEPTSTGFRRRL